LPLSALKEYLELHPGHFKLDPEPKKSYLTKTKNRKSASASELSLQIRRQIQNEEKNIHTKKAQNIIVENNCTTKYGIFLRVLGL
jgi:hypothetical protein